MPACMASLEPVAKLLSTTANALEAALCFRTMSVSRGSSYTIPRNKQQCKDTCDAFAKYLYSSLFDWLIDDFINDSLKGKPAKGKPACIGVLDIFGFENLSPETMPFPEGKRPANCYPKNQLAPQELLPNDPNSKWAQVNPMASGDIAGKNFLNAGALIGVNTVGQSLRNANWDIRAAPPCPQVEVSPWLQSTIAPDLQRRPLDIA